MTDITGSADIPSEADIALIQRILPHRYPFLLVDRILSFEPLKHVSGIKNVTVNEPFFQGHWPDIPVMPGVLIVEAMAQVGAVLIFGDNGEPNGHLAFLINLENAIFRDTVVPGDQLTLKAEMLNFQHDSCKIKAYALVDDAVAAEAVMSFGLMHIEE